jgi:hypothetical protein
MKLVRISTVLAVLGTCLAGGTVMATTASASGYGCPGSLVDTIPVQIGDFGTVVGDVYVYWDGTDNCAVAVDPSQNAEGISVSIRECQETVMTDECTPKTGWVTDSSSSYKWYAGPVSVNAVGHCVSVTGTITTSDGPHYSFYSGDARDC